MNIDNNKSFRLLNMFEKLNRGEIINKKEFAKSFGISEKTFQRDIDDLRAYLTECYENGDDITVEYDYIKGGYKLVKEEREFLTNDEILSIAKVLLESRGFNKEELNKLIDKLLLQATPSSRMNIKDLILKERFHYIEPKHKKPLLNSIWDTDFDYVGKREFKKLGQTKEYIFSKRTAENTAEKSKCFTKFLKENYNIKMVREITPDMAVAFLKTKEGCSSKTITAYKNMLYKIDCAIQLKFGAESFYTDNIL